MVERLEDTNREADFQAGMTGHVRDAAHGGKKKKKGRRIIRNGTATIVEDQSD